MKQLIKDKRLKKIIDSAENVFFEKGFAKTNLSDICKIAACSRTTLYTYFQNKENLYLAVINKTFAKFLNFLGEIDVSTKNGLESLLLYAKAYVDFCKKFPKHYQLMLSFHNITKNISYGRLESEGISNLKKSAYFDKVKKNAEAPFKNLDIVIQFGQQDKSIGSKINSKILAANLWSFFIGISVLIDFNDENKIQNIAGLKIEYTDNNYYNMIKRMIV